MKQLLKKLQKAIDKVLVYDNQEDKLEIYKNINETGMEAGYSNFIYYKNTCTFYDNNRKDIVKFLELIAKEYDQDLIEMLHSSKYFKDYTLSELGKVLYSDIPEKEENNVILGIKNYLTWATVELVIDKILNKE